MRIFLRQLFLVITLWMGVCFGILANERGDISLQDLPPEARQTLKLIKQGGPFPYEKDGSVFGNYEKLLPKRHRGFYREFTVKTPYTRNRGARRIVAGGEYPSYREFYYTEDHYASFKRIKE
jgi:ribonuclease T1